MIAYNDGVLAVKGTHSNLLKELEIIIYALIKKQNLTFDEISMVAAVAIQKSECKEFDDCIYTVMDRKIPNNEESDLEMDAEPITEDMLKKMFGDLFNE